MAEFLFKHKPEEVGEFTGKYGVAVKTSYLERLNFLTLKTETVKRGGILIGTFESLDAAREWAERQVKNGTHFHQTEGHTGIEIDYTLATVHQNALKPDYVVWVGLEPASESE